MPNQHRQEPTAFSLTDTVVDSKHAQPPSTSSDLNAIRSSTSTDSLKDEKLKPAGFTADPRLTPSTIPPPDSSRTYRTLVVCFDGTGDQFDADNSNIVNLVSLLKKDDKTKQMVYYQSGIGTYTSPKVATPLMAKFTLILDLMFAWNLNAHVMSGYKFLMQNYIAGDRICIFGFSRGAYTARSLAGMIHKVGLLPADNIQQVPFAYKMFTRDNDFGWAQSRAFKKSFSVDVDIEFLGVWDTVNSVGIIPKRLPFTRVNTIVHTFRHAISLDERRAKFKANHWNLPKARPDAQSSNPMENVTASPALSVKDKEPERERKFMSQEKPDLQIFEKIYSEKTARPTDVEEVWFAGCHCDVGGGSVKNDTRHSLARIPLRWMIRECFRTNSGIIFNTASLRELGLDPSTLYPAVTPRPPPVPVGDAVVQKVKSPSKLRRVLHRLRPKKISHVQEIPSGSPDTFTDEKAHPGIEEEEDLKDVLSPLYDQLRLQPAWWVLEILPLMQRYRRKDNNQVASRLRSNLARPREIPDARGDSVKIHRTVKMRMEARYPKEYPEGKRYSPKPLIKVAPTWVA